MSYDFLDAHASILTADSSVVSGSTQRPVINIGSVLSTIPTSSGASSVSGTVGASVIGTVPTTQSGTVITSVAGTTEVSVLGTVPVTNSNSSVFQTLTGLMSTNSSVISVSTNVGSVVSLNVGSVITVNQANSIVGTYTEDSGHSTGDRGLFTLGVRNDAVASFVSADLDYGPTATDSAGRPITKPFAPEESRVEGYISLTSASVTTLVAAGGAGIRNYITDVMVANTGASDSLITFSSNGGASILGYTIAPSGGGSNIIGLQTPIRTPANHTFNVQPATQSSTIYVTVKGFKAP